MVELHRSLNNKIIAGVCGGLAESVKINPIFMRLLFTLSILWGGSGLIIYLILWIVMPEINYDIHFDTNIERPLQNRFFYGVCAGIAQYFKIDVTLVRIVFIISSLYLGYGILIYLLLCIVLPNEKMENRGFND